MSSILDNQAVRSVVLPITVEQYHTLSNAGIIDESTELLRGVIVEKMTKSPLHTWTVQRLVQWFRSQNVPQNYVRQEQPLTLDVSEPEPDVAVVDGCPEDYLAAHPHTARLVVEVAISSEELDREKARDYAQANVPEYWLVLPERRVVEVHRDPSPTGYSSHASYSESDTIELASFPDLSFPVSFVFPETSVSGGA